MPPPRKSVGGPSTQRTVNQHLIPTRLKLSDQALEFLRHGLRQNRWKDIMPSEAELCRELNVSRVTLRRALALLFADGSLRPGGRGGRHAIVSNAKTRNLTSRPIIAMHGNLVRVLSPQPRFIISGDTQIIFQTMSETLGRAGWHLEFEHHPGLWRLKRPAALLRKLTSQPHVIGWLLYRSTQAVQEWFARSDIPAVVLGGVFPGISITNAEFDLVASCHHAAGVFASRGHRHMVFLTIEHATAGDQASAQAFLAGAAAVGAAATIATYDDTVPGLCRLLDGLLMSKPVPTAFFVAFPNHAHATIGHLTRRGYPVPSRASVISRLDARLLSESIPTIARYKMDAERLGRGLARLLNQSINNPAKNAPTRFVVMPEFIDGETAVAQPNAGLLGEK
jgi:DNA-binding LacI/PurR family transcriptional regulator